MIDLQGYGWMLWDGVQLTVVVSVFAMAGAIVVGLGAAFAKVSGSKVLSVAGEAYTTIVRGIPELVLLLLVYYGLPTLIQDASASLGYPVVVSLNPFAAGIAAITFIYGAFACEVFRAAYNAVPRGQFEAAAMLGLRPVIAYRFVILPQIMRYALPGLGNVWMVLVKATALISIIQLPELMRNADVAARATRMPFTFFFAACLLYLAITAVSMLLQARAEQWASRGVTEGRL